VAPAWSVSIKGWKFELSLLLSPVFTVEGSDAAGPTGLFSSVMGRFV
jgi:hypothetical protein